MKRNQQPNRRPMDPAIRQLIRALAHMQADADDAREMELTHAAQKDRKQ